MYFHLGMYMDEGGGVVKCGLKRRKNENENKIYETKFKVKCLLLLKIKSIFIVCNEI